MKRFLLTSILCLLLLLLPSCAKNEEKIDGTAFVGEKSEDARSKINEVPWYGEIPTEKSNIDGEKYEENDNGEEEEEPLAIEGEYSFYYSGNSFTDFEEEHKLEIKKNENEDYYQIIMYTPFAPPMYECRGSLYKDSLFFYTSEPSGWGISGEINFNNSYTPLTGNVTFEDGTEWGDVLSKHKPLKFYKDSDTPNMEIKWNSYTKTPENHDKYEGEYFSYESDNWAMEIAKNEDETYNVVIRDKRIPSIHCKGILKNNKMEFSTSDLSGDELKGIIEFGENISTPFAKVTFLEGSEWGDFLRNYGTIEYYKMNVPVIRMEKNEYRISYDEKKNKTNMMKENSYNPDKYEGEYFSYICDEPSLEIKKNNDNTYTINVDFHRNANYGSNSYYNLSGIEIENGIELFSTENTKTTITEYGETSKEEFDEKQIKGNIIFENNSIIAEVSIFGMNSERYYKTNNIPDMDYIHY